MVNRIGYEERKQVYSKALCTYGMENQLIIAIEEMDELTKEICKLFRGQQNTEAIAEEVADVTIMMEQIRYIFNINDEVSAMMDMKIERLQERIQEARSK
jgi:NTP pyrophosphatase (non-canonical NTP hydrolase)